MPLSTNEHDAGRLVHLEFANGKGNVLDQALIEELTGAFAALAGQDALAAVVISGAGKHFSFGASVEEHLPGKVEAMLPSFHALFRALRDLDRPILAAVSGQCLGGALELAAFCHRVFAHPGAFFGQPEIKLGVFAPVASLVLPWRIAQADADDLLLSGRSIAAPEALNIGLVDALAEDPVQAALSWARESVLPHSSFALRFAARAARFSLYDHFFRDLEALERRYLGELMAGHDPTAGLTAFLSKQPPTWEHR